MGTFIFSLCVFVVTLGDFVLFPLLTRGATLGKHIVAMTLVTSTHTVPRIPQILLRYAVFALPLKGLSLLQALFSMNGWLHTPLLLLMQWGVLILYIAPVFLRADRQSLGGLVSHTVLVEQK